MTSRYLIASDNLIFPFLARVLLNLIGSAAILNDTSLAELRVEVRKRSF